MKLTSLLLCVCTCISYADDWGPLEKTEFYSANKQHMLKIEPHVNWPDNQGHCRATLFRGKKELWSRHLINNHAPVRVFVADSGEYVVTMDEWHSVGDLPVVIYGRRGDLILVHSTDSLGLKDDRQHIKHTMSSYWWNEDSISFFGSDEETFFIRLHWVEWIVLELRSGRLLQKEKKFFRDDLRIQHEQEWKEMVAFRNNKLAEKAINLLRSKDSYELQTGALICGQEKLTQAIPALRKLLDDQSYFTQTSRDKTNIILYVRQASKSALEAMGEDAGNVVTELPEEGHLKYDNSAGRYVIDFGGN